MYAWSLVIYPISSEIANLVLLILRNIDVIIAGILNLIFLTWIDHLMAAICQNF